ncbi:MAG: ABC transporter permease [Mobilitalea sp.]
MKLAWKELKHSRMKYLLIESIIVLMIFMVIFLSGLANGLSRAVSAAIENENAKYYVISEDAENMIGISSLPKDVLEQVAGMTTDNVTNLDIQRTNLNTEAEQTKIDVTYFAINPAGFLAPDITEGIELSDTDSKYTIVLDDSFKENNIKIGDIVEDSAAGIKMTVVGFTQDEMYGHSPVGFISTNTYTAINTAVNPAYQEKYHAIAIQGSDIKNIEVEGMSVVDKSTIVDNIPGYLAEQLTINMILWVLVVISAAVLGVFFYVITIQKLKQFGILKAIGMGMMELAAMITGQVLLLAVFGVITGNILAFGMAAMLPGSMPFHLEIPIVIVISIVFIAITLVTSLLSIRKVAKVDPIAIIGGNE